MVDDWLDEVSELIEIVHDRGDVDYLEVIKGDLQIRISKNGSSPFALGSPATGSGHPVGEPEPPLAGSAKKRAEEPAQARRFNGDGGTRPEEREGTRLVRSPMVGVFYRAADPGIPPFVEITSTVAPDSTLALVEAMKVFSAVRAEISGVVEEIFVENGDFVEYDQPLFRISLN